MSAACLPEPTGFFLDRFALTEHALEETVGSAIARRADYADLYFEFQRSEQFALEDGIVKKATKNITQGAGVRVIAGEKTGYAHTDEVSVDTLRLASQTARTIADGGSSERAVALSGTRPPHDLYTLEHSPLGVDLSQKIDVLNRIDVAARHHDPRIKNVLGSLGIVEKVILIVTSSGLVVGDTQPLVRLSVACIAEEDGVRQQGSAGGGGRQEFDYLLQEDRYLRYVDLAASQAIRNLKAAEAPAGAMDVVLGPGWPGVLLHEAIGHGLEGDFNRKRSTLR